jgi:DNA helicase II / ATP-dependent DNA helicase PcrA
MNLIAIEHLLGSLNEEQRKAVAIGPGKAVVAGAPGSGKTRVMIARLVRLAREGFDLRWCLVTTFTRAAAAEINSRLEAMGITVGRVGTMHSLCAEINSLELVDLTAGLALDESGFKTTMLLKRVLGTDKYRNAGSYNLDEINRLFSIAKTSGPCPVFGNPFGLQVEAGKHLKKICEENEDLTGLPARLLVDAFIEYEKMRAANGIYDFDDLQSWAYQFLLTASDSKLTEWINRWSLIMCDEVQDLDPIQFDIMYLLSGLCSKLYPGRGVQGHGNLVLLGDASQCLDGATLIETSNGPQPIREVKKGDKVLSCVGGEPCYRSVLQAGSVQKSSQVEITLSDGTILNGSADHLAFACIPPEAKHYYAYIMHKPGVGYRIGTTHGARTARRDSLAVRMQQEGADRIWLVSSFPSKEEAALFEEYASLYYRIPKLPFNVTSRSLRVTNDGANSIFGAFGPNGAQLLRDYWLLTRYPTHVAQSNSGDHSRIVINVLLGCKRAHMKSLQAEVLVESQLIAPEQLRSTIYAETCRNVQDGNMGTGRIRAWFDDGAKAHSLAEDLLIVLQRVLPTTQVNIRVALAAIHGPGGARFLAMPLSGVIEGLFLCTKDGAKEVVKHRRYTEEKTLYDLQIEGSTNYYANGVCVHNSLYGFRGATPEYFVDFAQDRGTGLYQLPVNYRSNKDICALASSLVREKDWHLTGDIQPGPDAEQLTPPLSHGAPIRFQEFLNSNYEAQWVVAEAMRMREELGSWRSITVLSRLSMFLNLVELECIRNNIPYEKRASGDFVGGRDIAALVGYLRVAGGWDPTGKWERAIVNTPFRYIGKQALYDADNAKKPGESYIDTLLDVAKLSVRQRESLRDLRQLLVVLRKRIEKGAKPQELLKSVLKWTGFMESLRQESGTTGIDSTKMAVVANIEWLSGLYDSTQEFLAYMDQLGEGLKLGRKRLKTEDSSQDALVLSTIHSFKGQEASVVFLCDLVQGRHPWDRAHSMDEELRLAYVAVSRAKLALTITFSRSEDGIESSILRKLLSQATILTTQLNRLEIPSHLERVQKEPPF